MLGMIDRVEERLAAGRVARFAPLRTVVFKYCRAARVVDALA